MDKENLIEGDIIFRSSDENKILGSRNAIIDPHMKWGKDIPYEIGEEYEFENVDLIEDVIRELEVRTCLNFHQRDPNGDEFTYIKFKRHNGCSSAVGRQGGSQIVSIDTGCEYRGVIQHETLHALGFWHEQSRYDRDDYVEIKWENIAEGHEFNFVKYSEDEIKTLGAAYDYSSVMHYGPYDFSSNGQPTIVALKDEADEMGQREKYSPVDWWKLRKLYGCDMQVSGWSDWTEWSRCDENCEQYRSRWCENSEQCKDEEERQTQYQDCPLCIKRVDKDCGRKYSLRKHTTITSPLYPYPYKLDVSCEQVFKVEGENERIIFDIEHIDVEALDDGYCFDWLKVYDGPSTDAKQLGRFCGKARPKPIISSGNSITLLFFSDYSVSWQGFFAKISTTSQDSLIHACYFEGGVEGCDWLSDPTADYDWFTEQGQTTSSSTGPNFDHTTLSNQGRYIFVESSSPYTQGMKARVLTPYIVTSSNDDAHCLRLWYMLYGENIGSFSVYLVVNDERVSEVFTDSGDRGKTWLEAQVTVRPNTSIYQLAFEGVRGDGYRGDIALDDVIIMQGSCDEDQEGSGEW